METKTDHTVNPTLSTLPSLEVDQDASASFLHWPPLAQETRDVVPTDCAAYHLNRRPQTLRAWACLDNGPIRPTRVFGRLHWKTADLRRLLGVAK